MKLGNEFETNNIYLGDCYELIKKLPDNCIDLVVIDPPYEFCAGGNGSSEIAQRKFKQKKEMYSLDTKITKKNIVSGGGCFGTKKRDYHSQLATTDVSIARKKYLDYVEKNGVDEESERLRSIANAVDNRENTSFISEGFSNDILDELVRVMKKVNIYIWCSKAQISQILNYFEGIGCNIDLLVWGKTNCIPTCNNTYLSNLEYCIFAREGGVKVYGSVKTKSKYYISECNVADKKLYDHPTIKPLDIIKNLVFNSSQENDIVLDTFLGSGTTAVACKELNRQYIGFELNEEFYEIAKNRLEGLTQEDRKKREEGQVCLF